MNGNGHGRGPERYAFIGTYPPRQCGIATFTADLCRTAKAQFKGTDELINIALTNEGKEYSYPEEVKFEIHQKDLADYKRAADFLNHSQVSLVCLQHEFGIFGGDAGEYVLSLVKRLKMPVVTTLHTVLENDARSESRIVEGRVLRQVCQHSHRVVVMNQKAEEMLRTHGVPEHKVVYIPHGIPELPFGDPEGYKERFGLFGKTVILTFGLLSPNKGIEYTVHAMSEVADCYPDAVYVILGATHPEIVRQYGETYRDSLKRIVSDLGLESNVLFENRFVSLKELCEYLCAADIYVTPYLSREQMTSGTLAYAVGAGKAVISTPYWYAEEVLADGRGMLVPFKNAEALSKSILCLLDNPEEMLAMRERAYRYGLDMVWKQVGHLYLDLFEEVLEEKRTMPVILSYRSQTALSTSTLPDPKLSHLAALSDNFGLLQHAKYAVPDYHHGYCLDDNARAIVVSAKHNKLYHSEESVRLLGRYLSFTHFCQKEDGSFHNFVSIDRRYLDDVGSEDTLGRALWGLGYAVHHAPFPHHILAKECFDRAVPHLKETNLRGAAYSVLGLHQYLERYPGALDIRDILGRLTEHILQHYRDAHHDHWLWFEHEMTYDNGMIPLALWLATYHVNNPEVPRVAEIATDFLFKWCQRGGHLSLVGCDGWHACDKMDKAHFDQQPIDACGLAMLAKSAYRFTGNPEYLVRLQMAFEWFLGYNDIGKPLYDPATGGCYDGLTPDGPNLNEGAESTLSFLLALLNMIEIASEEERDEVWSAFSHKSLALR
ncbi:MAG: glycosyltransferase family 4 protein [Armatimonadetes bacterium]|nr:glycosyltransferase family 4 protein [Armatimonadota bacterium]